MTLTGLTIKGRCVELEVSISSERGWGTEEETEAAEEVETVAEAVVEVEAVVEAVEAVEAARNGLEDPATRPGTRVDTGLGIRSLVLLYIFWRKASILSPGLSVKTIPA